MAFDYARMRQTAERLLAPPNGQQGNLRAPGGALTSCRFVLFPFTFREQDGDLIQEQDEQGFLSPSVTRAPDVVDRLVLANGQERRIMSAVALDPNASGPVLWLLHVRKV